MVVAFAGANKLLWDFEKAIKSFIAKRYNATYNLKYHICLTAGTTLFL